MVAAAIIGSAAIGAVGSIAGSSAQAGAAKKASQLVAPFAKAGTAGIPGLEGLLGINGQDMSAALAKTPGYKFTLGQGLEAVQNGFAARGLASSGAALKGAANYATGLAQDTYQNQVANYQNFVNAGANAAAQQGSNLIQAGNAQAAGLVGAANSIGGGLTTYALLNNANLANLAQTALI